MTDLNALKRSIKENTEKWEEGVRRFESKRKEDALISGDGSVLNMLSQEDSSRPLLETVTP